MNLIDDENLNYFIKDFALGDGLLSSFYYDNQEYFFDKYPNEIPERLQQLNEQEKEYYIDECIKKNAQEFWADEPQLDRKSTRLNSSHVAISYAVFCLKKKITEI